MDSMKEASSGCPGEGSIKTCVISGENLVTVDFLALGNAIQVGDNLLLNQSELKWSKMNEIFWVSCEHTKGWIAFIPGKDQ